MEYSLFSPRWFLISRMACINLELPALPLTMTAATNRLGDFSQLKMLEDVMVITPWLVNSTVSSKNVNYLTTHQVLFLSCPKGRQCQMHQCCFLFLKVSCMPNTGLEPTTLRFRVVRSPTEPARCPNSYEFRSSFSNQDLTSDPSVRTGRVFHLAIGEDV